MQNLMDLMTICSDVGVQLNLDCTRHEMEEGAGGGSRQLMDNNQTLVHSERAHTTISTLQKFKDHDGKCRSEDGAANLDLYSSSSSNSSSSSPPQPPLVSFFSSQEFNKMIPSKLSAYDSASFSCSVVPPTSLSSSPSSSSSSSPYSLTDFISTWPLSSLASPISSSSSLPCQQTMSRTSICTMNSSTKSLFCQKQHGQPKLANLVVRLSLFLFLVTMLGQQQPMTMVVEAHSPPRSQNSLAILGPNSYNYYRTTEKNDSGATENNDSNQGRLTFDRNRLISLLNQRINDRFRNNGLQPAVNRNPYYKPKPATSNPIDSFGTEPESKSIQYPLLALLSNQKLDSGVQSIDPYYHYSYYEQLKNRLLAENRQPAISMSADKQQQFPTCKQLRYLWMVKNYFKSLLGDDGTSDSLPSGGDSEIEDYLNKQNNDDIENGIKDGSAVGNDYENNGDETMNKQKLVYISKIVPSRDEYNDYANQLPSGGGSVQPLDQPAYGIVRTSPSGSDGDSGIDTATKAYDQHRRKPTFGEFLEAELSPTTIDSGEQQSDQQSASGVALARKSPPIIVRPSIKFNMENRAASTKNNNNNNNKGNGGGNGGGSGKNRGNSSDNGKSRSRFSSSQMPGSWHNKPVIPSVRIIS